MYAQDDNIETNTSIIEKISRLTKGFVKFINFWKNDFAFIENDSYKSFESFLKQTHIP